MNVSLSLQNLRRTCAEPCREEMKAIFARARNENVIIYRGQVLATQLVSAASGPGIFTAAAVCVPPLHPLLSSDPSVA